MEQIELPALMQYSIEILGVRFNRISLRDAVEQILQWIAEKSRRMVITAGPEFVMKAQQDEVLKKMAFVADMVTPDGIGVVWAARRHGVRINRVTGVELVEYLLDTAKKRKLPLKVYLLGAKQSSLDGCIQRFRQKYPQMVFQGHDGYFQKNESSGILKEVERFEPDLWLVGLGQPRQEKIIYQSLAGLPPCVGIGVGGSIDVWSGAVQRAPRIVQKIHLEWLFRLLKEPSRWRRQLALPRFAWKVLRKEARRSNDAKNL